MLFAVGGLLAIAGMAFGVEIKGVSGTRQPLFDALSALCGPHTAGQSFVAAAPNLNRVDLWLAWSRPQESMELAETVTPAPSVAPTSTIQAAQDLKYRLFLPIAARSPDDLRLSSAYFMLSAEGCDVASHDDESAITISLREDPTSSEAVATNTFRLNWEKDPATAVLGPQVYQSLVFPAIPDSEGRIFYLSIETPDASASTPLLVRYHHRDVYAKGTRHLDGAPATGDLAFRVHYGAAPMSDFWLLLYRLARDRPNPFNLPWLYPTLLAVFAGFAALVIKAIMQNLKHVEGRSSKNALHTTIPASIPSPDH